MPDVETNDGRDDEEDDYPPQRRNRRGNSSNINSHKHHKFPLWEEDLAWEDYKKMIKLFVNVAKKDPEEIFLDMINALKESKRRGIATRLMNKFEDYATNKKVIEDSLKFIEASFGTTLTDRLEKAAEALQTIRREEDEDMAEFILRFEAVIEQLNMVQLDLTDRMEATILQRSANLTKAKKNNLVPMIDMSSTAQGITLKMKEPLKQIGFRKA